MKETNPVSVHVSTQPGFTTGEPVALPIREQLVLQNPTFQRNYDISPDGKYFIAVIRAPEIETIRQPPSQIEVVLN